MNVVNCIPFFCHKMIRIILYVNVVNCIPFLSQSERYYNMRSNTFLSQNDRVISGKSLHTTTRHHFDFASKLLFRRGLYCSIMQKVLSTTTAPTVALMRPLSLPFLSFIQTKSRMHDLLSTNTDSSEPSVGKCWTKLAVEPGIVEARIIGQCL